MIRWYTSETSISRIYCLSYAKISVCRSPREKWWQEVVWVWFLEVSSGGFYISSPGRFVPRTSVIKLYNIQRNFRARIGPVSSIVRLRTREYFWCAIALGPFVAFILRNNLRTVGMENNSPPYCSRPRSSSPHVIATKGLGLESMAKVWRVERGRYVLERILVVASLIQ